ncbi:hypothetical protein IE979_25110 [Klebsiella pneumoniae]|uniref:Uncharacterized protein n=1 Tax=Klebsiella pneumoniae TaxID=573 RepID=A0A927HPQ9_KLEPN|nr:hypothetical protein [Klebsiella pneumoniae]
MQTGKRADTGNVPGVLFSPDTADLMWLRRNGYQCRGSNGTIISHPAASSGLKY